MNFATLQPLLVAFIATVSGVDSKFVVWENEPRVMTRGTLVTLAWVSARGVGSDELRYEAPAEEDIDADSTLAPAIFGNRVLALQIAIETRNALPNAPHAFAIAETIRKRMRRPSSRDLLLEMNVGVVSLSPTTRADYVVDQRMVPRAILELTLNATDYDVDTDDTGTGWVEHAEVTSHFAGEDSEQLTDVLQVTAEVMPPIEE